MLEDLKMNYDVAKPYTGNLPIGIPIAALKIVGKKSTEWNIPSYTFDWMFGSSRYSTRKT